MGLKVAGFKHAGLLEINHQACESLRANFDPNLVHEVDVTKVDFSDFKGVDVVSGGPPCQPFSLGGLAKAYNDRRDMFPQAIRAISEIMPAAFIFENVKGLLRAKFAPYFTYIIHRLSFPDCKLEPGERWTNHVARLKEIADGKAAYSGLHYNVEYKLLNAADFGVPQIRERVFIVGIRSDISEKWTWPAPTCATKCSRVSIEEALRGVPDPRDAANSLPDHIFIEGARTYPGHTGSDVSLPSKTIKAGAHGVPGGENMLRLKDGTLRYMTVHEAKLIQSFPTDFTITGSWGEALRQIGNAVPVKLAQVVGEHLKNFLSKYKKAHWRRRTRSFPATLKGEQALFTFVSRTSSINREQKQHYAKIKDAVCV